MNSAPEQQSSQESHQLIIFAQRVRSYYKISQNHVDTFHVEVPFSMYYVVTGLSRRGQDSLHGSFVEDCVTDTHHAHHCRGEEDVGEGRGDTQPETGHHQPQLGETEPGDDSEDLLQVDPEGWLPN